MTGTPVERPPWSTFVPPPGAYAGDNPLAVGAALAFSRAKQQVKLAELRALRRFELGAESGGTDGLASARRQLGAAALAVWDADGRWPYEAQLRGHLPERPTRPRRPPSDADVTTATRSHAAVPARSPAQSASLTYAQIARDTTRPRDALVAAAIRLYEMTGHWPNHDRLATRPPRGLRTTAAVTDSDRLLGELHAAIHDYKRERRHAATRKVLAGGRTVTVSNVRHDVLVAMFEAAVAVHEKLCREPSMVSGVLPSRRIIDAYLGASDTEAFEQAANAVAERMGVWPHDAPLQPGATGSEHA